MKSTEQEQGMETIAIVGMSGRFPGAGDTRAFWKNLKSGLESISHFEIDELEVSGGCDATKADNYVRSRSVLEGVDCFDASFFGIYPQEAKLMDPQHRLFLECCWGALEDAGYDPLASKSPVGVFAGCSPNSYFLTQIVKDAEYVADYAASYQVGHYTTMLGTIADTLATRVAYKLNLRGPAITMLSACSTSLVAICQACTSLLTYQCDAALAGGVSITFPQKRGYLYQAGGMVSPDGHCRPFDAEAQGTVFGSGAGVVALKRTSEALADGDHIYAVIKGFSTNNDGSEKVGFTAPSIAGQAAAIEAAQAMADIPADSISYIEAHGTATPLGDPIEVAALTQAFRRTTSRRNFCALGTAKANVGHLDVAAGVTGVIKTALSLKHREIPPLANFRSPNPKLHLETSPFFATSELREWKRDDQTPLRAGVSAFGVGGTNAHVILEEAPCVERGISVRTAQLLVLSARSEEALDQASQKLADHLEIEPGLNLGDVSFTLAAGRHGFEFRRAVVCQDSAAAVGELRSRRTADLRATAVERANGKVYFVFPGQGSQYLRMGAGLYETESVFRKAVDECAKILIAGGSPDLRPVLFDAAVSAGKRLDDTEFAQPAIFTIEYALAQLWLSWGIRPDAMIGHSVGEFVAASLAGTFTLEDGLKLVSERARLMQCAPPGAMLSVRLAEAELIPLLEPGLSIAAVNSPRQTVAAGSFDAIDKLQQVLETRGIAARRLRTSHAFHSALMDAVLQPFGEVVRGIPLRAPSIPYVSCTTGDWITEADATDADYWTSHLRKTVRFGEALSRLSLSDESFVLEVGTGNTLQTLVRQNGYQKVAASSSLIQSSTSESESILRALGSLWVRGIKPDWPAYFAGEGRKRVALPTYPFERLRFWAGDDISKGQEARVREANVHEQQMVIDSKVPDARLGAVTASVTTLISELSGVPGSEIAPSASFLELGFDSLFLTQVALALQKRFSVKVAFSQLLDDLNCVESITDYLLSSMPPSAVPAAAPAPTPQSPGIASAPALPEASEVNASGMERLMKLQLDAMSQLALKQLELLRSGTVASPAQNAVAPVVSQPKPAKEEFKPFGPYKPAQRGPIDSLSPNQREYLDALTARYTAKTAQSKELTAKYRKVLADPRVASGFRLQWKELVYPITTNRSRGSRIWDIDGNEYIDLLNGFGPIALGHLPEFVLEAARAQLEQGIEIGPQTRLAGEVAELLCEITGMERATFCNTGSEAVMAALRIARTVTGRNKVVFFAGDYHGNFDEVLLKPGRLHSGPATPIAPGIPPEAGQNVVVLEYGSAEALKYIREHASDLAAVLVEPVQSRHPGLRPREFLEQIRAITAEAETALIFDEIVTGFRLHLGGAQAYYGIRADMATYGKVLGGGFPIGAIAGSARFMDALDGGDWRFGDESLPTVGVTFFAGTFVRHPLAMSAAKAVLTYLKQQGPELQLRLAQRTEALVKQLNEAFGRYAAPLSVESCGSFFYFGVPSSFRFGSLLYYHLRERGIYIQEGFPCFLTTAHSEEDLATVVQAFNGSLAEMQRGGVLPQAQPAPVESQVVHEATEAPLTEPQLEVLVSAKLSQAANCSYNESFTIDLQGPLNLTALEESIGEVLKRHQILRSTFDLEAKLIHFSPEIRLPVERVDLSSAGPMSDEFTTLVEREAETPFDLEKGPVVRIKMICFGAEHHRLLVTAHHIVCDGWSINVLIQELGEIYSALTEQRAARLIQPLSFAEYSMGLQREAATAEAAATAQYWRNRFHRLPPLLDLPVDRPRPSVKAFEGGTVRRILPPEFAKAMKSLGASQGCTLFMTLLSGCYVLLSRLTGADDIVVGVPAAAQSLVEGKSLVGHCVNFLPLRAAIDGQQGFSQFQKSCKSILLEAYKHQNYTFGTLVRELRIPRDPSRLPLIEVQFNLERVGQAATFAGLQAEVDSCPKKFVNFDLFLNIVESPKGLILDCDYNTGLFDEATVARWLRCYETLLAAAAQRPDENLQTLPLLNDVDREALLALNPAPSPYPSQLCVHQLVEKQVALGGSRIAAIHRGHSITYGDLDRRADQLAAFLVKNGATANQPVGILLARSIEMVVCLLAVLKAGAAYLPLDPSHPASRLELILQEASPAIILTSERIAASLNAPHSRIVCVDVETTGTDDGAVEASIKADDLAYIIYTSGSTGRPKGVEISHRAVVNFLCSMMTKPGISAEDRLLAVTTLSFDIAALEIFLPLSSGACVVIADQGDTQDGYALRGLIEKHRISMLQATPSTWRLLLEAGWKPNAGVKMLCGGEALPRGLADELLAEGLQLWNMYGPTETTIWSAVSRVEAGPGPVKLGPPIANTQFYVLDEKQQLQPAGVPGELYIGGDGLARGYFKRPELTREKFIPCPFTLHGSRGEMYRTGDLVRVTPDGSIEFLGRLDHQVKLRGFRIELGEIESVLMKSAPLSDVVVTLYEQSGVKHLVAYYCSSETVDELELKLSVSSALPAYMIPTYFVRLALLPRTPNGKIDRKALPAPELTRRKEARPPHTEAEKKLAAVCQQVLSIESINVDDNLFELGADSIQIFRIVSRASLVGIRLTAQQILRSPRIMDLSTIEVSAESETKPATTGIKPVPRSQYREKRSSESVSV